MLMGGRLPGLGAGPIRGGQTGICQSPGLQTSSSAMSTQKAKIKEFRGVTHARSGVGATAALAVMALMPGCAVIRMRAPT